jgi:hypothetical protein
MKAIEELKTTEDQYKVIGVSTCHIMAADAARLEQIRREGNNMVMPRDTGAFVKLYPDIDGETRNLEEDYPGFTDAFYNVLKLAKEAGYSMVEFDSAATEYESLSSFDW